MVIHLPGGRSIIIDAKAPMTAYLHAGETDRQEERSQWMSRHAAGREKAFATIERQKLLRPVFAVP